MASYPVVLNLNGTVDIPVGNMAYVEFDETAPYVDIIGGGVIDITDFQTTFGSDIGSKVVKCDIWVMVSGQWFDSSRPPEGISYDGLGNLKTIQYNLNWPNGVIQALKGKIY